MRARWFAIAALPALNLLAAAQDAAAPDRGIPPILIRVTVFDKSNHTVSGLTKVNFRIFDGGNEQKVEFFQTGDAPLTLGVVADLSGSMLSSRPLAHLGPLWRSRNPEDEFLLITFQDKPQVRMPLTRRPTDFSQLIYASPRGQTALLDALLLAIHEIQYSQNPAKALVLITDGGDNNSLYSQPEIVNVVRDAGVALYAVLVVAQEDRFRFIPREEQAQGVPAIRFLVEQTGGRAVVIASDRIPDGVAAIAQQLRAGYLLGFSPAASQDTKDRFHKLKVEVVAPAASGRLRVAARGGYIAAGR